MMKRISRVVGGLIMVMAACMGGAAFGQDPLKVAPEAYKLEFENEWVKVTRVHYAAHAKIPAHDHTESGAAYVYLNDSGPILFKHIDASYGAITRQPVKAGSFRLYKAVKEVHEVENPNDAPSDFLRVEFKTEADNEQSIRGRYFREDHSAEENLRRVHFENAQIRAVRIYCITGKACEVEASAAEPVLLVALAPLKIKSSGKTLALDTGQTLWLDAGKKASLANGSNTDFLIFEFKSKPVKSSLKEKAPHAHPHNHED